MPSSIKLPASLLILTLAVLIWSGIKPYERMTWWMEVAPVLIALPILLCTYKKFRLTDLLYVLIAIHGVILMVGGHYTYALVPLFDWIRDCGWGQSGTPMTALDILPKALSRRWSGANCCCGRLRWNVANGCAPS